MGGTCQDRFFLPTFVNRGSGFGFGCHDFSQCSSFALVYSAGRPAGKVFRDNGIPPSAVNLLILIKDWVFHLQIVCPHALVSQIPGVVAKVGIVRAGLVRGCDQSVLGARERGIARSVAIANTGRKISHAVIPLRTRGQLITLIDALRVAACRIAEIP